MEKIEKVQEILENTKDRSKWGKGVNDYALELLENLKEYQEQGTVITLDNLEEIALNGAENWSNYSWGGGSEIYNENIAKRLSTPSELKRTDNGRLNPNRNEEWLDTQARALYQAFKRIERNFKKISNGRLIIEKEIIKCI